jgi:hypothetical protein
MEIYTFARFFRHSVQAFVVTIPKPRRLLELFALFIIAFFSTYLLGYEDNSINIVRSARNSQLITQGGLWAWWDGYSCFCFGKIKTDSCSRKR